MSRGKLRQFSHLVVVLSVALTGTVYAGSVKHEEKIHKTIEIRDESRLVVESKSGDITILGEAGRNEVQLTIIKRVKAKSQEEAERLAGLLDIEIDRDGRELVISTKYPKGDDAKRSIFSYLMRRYPKMSMELILVVPPELDIELTSASGDLSVSNINGSVELTAASGDLQTINIGGSLNMVVASGDIEVENVDGEARFSSASGDITAHKLSSDALIQTASGDVEMIDIGGDVEAETISGDIVVEGVGSVIYKGVSGSARFIDVRGGVSAATASGDLTFRVIPEDNFDYTVSAASGDIKLHFLMIMPGGYVLKAGTTTGDINASLPIRLTKVGRNRVAGIVREGRSKVVLETASGDILILEPEE